MGDVRMCVHRDIAQGLADAMSKKPCVRGFGTLLLLVSAGGMNKGDTVLRLSEEKDGESEDEIEVEGAGGAVFKIARGDVAGLHTTDRPLEELLVLSGKDCVA